MSIHLWCTQCLLLYLVLLRPWGHGGRSFPRRQWLSCGAFVERCWPYPERLPRSCIEKIKERIFKIKKVAVITEKVLAIIVATMKVQCSEIE